MPDVSHTVSLRRKTFTEMQPWLFSYSAAIGIVSPLATLYQLLRINPQLCVPVPRMVYLSAVMFPAQTFLKQAQMNAMSPVKEHVNVWAAFGLMGELYSCLTITHFFSACRCQNILYSLLHSMQYALHCRRSSGRHLWQL